jgi:hypothetical protein
MGVSVPVHPIRWRPCWRIVPTRYPEEKILEKVSEPEDVDVVSDLEQMTNERLRQERGQVALVAPRDCVSGVGSQYIMAPFTYRNPEASRFSDGTHGVYYAAHALPTAVEETKHHRAIFMSRTKENPMRLEMRVLIADLDGELHDIRGLHKKFPQVYSRTSDSSAQALAGDLVKSSSYGIVYDSVRHLAGQCVAVFRPPVLSRCRPERHMIFEWDGETISRVYELKEI